ncbi:hypothetical protein FUT88_08065 [Ralstonia sp. TCR112]|uniref:hypothetical protein n=1 Tax=Ralstonia sp. TCR112 TaxID=2601730 RepID=UPI0011BF31D4|nr:hypothetical protein [Ralstonia sp. TCR112]TXD61599.1 hypothetical protein FUT88_08065 [Ralstonia sp. TCR112]
MDAQAQVQKPQAVRTAVNLLWTSLAVCAVKVLLDFSYISIVAPVDFTIVVLAFTFAVMAMLIFKISSGSNWARIALLVLLGAGTLLLPETVQGEVLRLPLLAALSVVQAGLQVYALFLLFSKLGKGWFRRLESA